jgi:hypothetical protein
MPLSNSVLRRYTPPTCTLEIAATNSPLSRWAGKSIAKDLRFELRFDDPRQPEEERVTIRGNAQDLEMLSDAVNNYIQNFLNSSTELPLTLGTTTNGNSTPDHRPNGNGNTGFTQNVNTFQQNIPEQPLEVDNTLALNPAQSKSIHSFQPRTAPEIHLQPKGLLSHELFFGDLATAESGLTVDLSVLQLFDLATALDEYAAELVALPKQNNPLAWKKAPPAWTSAAAMVVLAVGVTGGIAYFNQQNQPQTTALKTTPTPGLTPLSPLPVPVAPVVISPLPTPVVPPSLATVPTLSPPTPVTIPAPGTATLPPGKSITPNTAVNSSPTAIAIVPRRPTIPNSSSGGIPSIAGAPSVPPRSPINSAAGTTPTQPPLPKAPTTPPALNLPTIKNPSPAPENATTAQVDASRTRGGGSASDANPAASAPAPNSANNKLSDTIPQVAEARNYLQSRWKPPADFQQTLEYRLNVSPTGSIDTVDPLGQAAAKYIDQTGIPKPGDQFVSPVSNGANAKIRVVFKPDGTVSTFLEQ